MREEDVSAEQPEAEQDPRLSHPDAHPRRQSRDSPAAIQGPLEAVRLIWRVRDRATFRALARARRRRSGAVEVMAAFVGGAGEPPRVAFAVSRRVGGSVVRNRIRRQLRAAVHEERALLQDGWAYLVRPVRAGATYDELRGALRDALAAHTEAS